jgi:hypothetical protein
MIAQQVAVGVLGAVVFACGWFARVIAERISQRRYARRMAKRRVPGDW